ncbi:MAG TPA: serine protease [Burkholderiales bacterium]|nr:serine protease [Burkholderiales bacterium]
MRNRRVHALFALLASLGVSPAAAQEAQVSAQARSLYEQTRDSVAQIRVLLGSSDSHAATGTGFVVGAGGLILTNYHVVADKALEPNTYRLEFVLPDGRRGELGIVAVDVVHDLALVRGDIGGATPLSFRDSQPSKGDKGFSLGYPLNQGLTVVEGIYNGRSEEQYYERIHFTGAINPGMSGGPAVDVGGRGFGINVANHRRGQLVSFLVPAKFAQQLLSKPAAGRPGETDFRAEVGSQLRAHGAEIMGALLKAQLPVQTLGEFSLPGKSGEFMQCGAGTERDANKPYTVDHYRCYTWSSLYIDQRLYTGMVSFRHSILRSAELGALRFAYLQESRFAAGKYEAAFDRKHHTRYACRDGIVALKGTRAKMVMCVRAYRQFEGLYDVVVKIATVGDVGRALHSQLELEGVSFQSAMTYVGRYVEAIRWSR